MQSSNSLRVSTVEHTTQTFLLCRSTVQAHALTKLSSNELLGWYTHCLERDLDFINRVRLLVLFAAAFANLGELSKYTEVMQYAHRTIENTTDRRGMTHGDWHSVFVAWAQQTQSTKPLRYAIKLKPGSFGLWLLYVTQSFRCYAKGESYSEIRHIFTTGFRKLVTHNNKFYDVHRWLDLWEDFEFQFYTPGNAQDAIDKGKRIDSLRHASQRNRLGPFQRQRNKIK